MATFEQSDDILTEISSYLDIAADWRHRGLSQLAHSYPHHDLNPVALLGEQFEEGRISEKRLLQELEPLFKTEREWLVAVSEELQRIILSSGAEPLPEDELQVAESEGCHTTTQQAALEEYTEVADFAR